MDRVEKLLSTVTTALDRAGVEYAVVGGNAVAAWVAHADPRATRSTKDVDILADRIACTKIDAVLADAGLTCVDVCPMRRYTDPADPSKRAGVHLVWADELIRPSYSCPSPSVREVVRDAQGFRVLDLPALVRMKFTSFRDIDRVHVADLLSVGLITDEVRRALPSEFLARLVEIDTGRDDDALDS